MKDVTRDETAINESASTGVMGVILRRGRLQVK